MGMATETRTETELGERLNDLYWNSGLTVDEIVSDLGISRNALYAALEPIPTGEKCTVCGGKLVFPNRTHRTAETGTCEECGIESTLGEIAPSRANGSGPASFASSMNVEAFRHMLDSLEAIEPRRAAMIGGAATVGMLIGIAATRTLRS